MSAAAHKPNALTLVLDLTSRLATDYPTVPLEIITSCVQNATAAVRLFGDDATTAMSTVDALVRADLGAIVSETPYGAELPAALAS